MEGLFPRERAAALAFALGKRASMVRGKSKEGFLAHNWGTIHPV
jgi:hypothetical protein